MAYFPYLAFNWAKSEIKSSASQYELLIKSPVNTIISGSSLFISSTTSLMGLVDVKLPNVSQIYE